MSVSWAKNKKKSENLIRNIDFFSSGEKNSFRPDKYYYVSDTAPTQ